MTRKPTIVLIVLLGAAQLAAANPLGGLEKNWGTLIVLVLVLAMAYELVVTLVEAIVYKVALGLRFRNALGISFLANLTSLIAGFMLSAPGILGRFAVACAFEVPIVVALTWKKSRNNPWRPVLAGLGANLLTHAVTAIFIRW